MSSEKPTADVAVIIPTYNRAELVLRALESVCEQTTSPREVVVVDDGSEDDTATRLEGLSRVGDKFPFELKIVPLVENHGVSYARNRGVERATAKWLAFLDSDDEWRPRKLEYQVEALAKNPGYRLCHTDEIWIRAGNQVLQRQKHQKKGGDLFRQSLGLCAISPSSVLLDRTLLEEVGGFDEALPACEDYDLWLRVTVSESVLLVDEPLVVKYGGHKDQLSRKHWGMDRFRVKALDKLLGSGKLSAEQWDQARTVLLSKAAILRNGAAKRGKLDEVEQWVALRRLWKEAHAP